MEDITGRQLGPYRVVAPLGEGGMAAVYKAYQPGVDRYVALKILPRQLANDPQFVARFRQEARLIASLQHPHILPVHDFGEADGYTYLVMSFVDSGDLAELMQGQPLPFDRIRSVVSQVGDALDYAHSRGIVHRDVKPSNVLIDARGNCLLTDFGIAKMVAGTSKLTETGGVLGTPAYMSPEQGTGETLDGRSDIYSLGVILYEMSTGRAPFKAETPIAVVIKHINDPLLPPRGFNPGIPEDFERVILRAMAKRPDDRFSTAADMVRALQNAIPEAGLVATPAGGSPAVGSDTVDVRADSTAAKPVAAVRARGGLLRRLPVWVWAVAGLAAVGLVAFGLALTGGGQSAPAPTSTRAFTQAASVVSVPATATSTPEPTPTSAPTPFGGGTGRIAFTSFRSGEAEIYVMNADGSDQAHMPVLTLRGTSAKWSPDGLRLAYHSDRDGNFEIYTANADGSDEVNLTLSKSNDQFPAWSPDGEHIAFVSDRDGDWEIYVMNADGSGQVNLTNNLVADQVPDWAPDGVSIVLQSSRDGNSEIYVMHADGTNETRLTSNEYDDIHPFWSPDGKRIAFQSNRDGNWEIYVMNADGTGQTRLTDNPAVDQVPRWSPDGTKMVFHSDRDGNYNIYMMNADGSEPMRLTDSPAPDVHPVWQP